MNPVIQAQLKAFTTSNQMLGFDESDYFEVFSIHSLINGALSENVNPFDVHLAGQEFGLDGVGITVQGELCRDIDGFEAATAMGADHNITFNFFQAKRSEKFDYGDISKFLNAVREFFEDEDRNQSDQMDDLLDVKHGIYGEVLQENPKIRCYYVTTGNYEQVNRIEKLVDASKVALAELNIFSDIEICLVGAGSLQNYYRQATSSNTTSIEFSTVLTLPDHQSASDALIGYIAARELLRLVVIDPDNIENSAVNKSVFFDNVRDYNPNSPINKSINDDILTGDNSSFVFKNNGVTVVARSIDRTRNSYKLNEFQIVNGCQTCNVLYNNIGKLDGIFVPLRVIGSEDREFVSSIIIGTNSQNEVKQEQFWALRPFVKDLEEYCQQQDSDKVIYIERREFQYKDQSVERTRITKPSDLMKCIAAMFLYEPNRAARDYRAIRSEYEDQIFQQDHDVRPYHLACLANYKLDFITRNRIARSYGIYKYYTLFSIGKSACNGDNIFNMSSNARREACNVIDKLVSNEDSLIDYTYSIKQRFDEILENSGITTREQLRDSLRSERAMRDFQDQLPVLP